MEGDAGNVLQQLMVQLLHVLMVGNMVGEHRHLAAADTSAHIAHAIIVADGRMLIVGIGIACLSCVPHDGLSILCILTDEGSTT